MDSTILRARPLPTVGYGPRCLPAMQLAEAAAGLCGLQAAYRPLHELAVIYTDVRR